MPHARAQSLEPRAAVSWCSGSNAPQYGKGGGGVKLYNHKDNLRGPASRQPHTRTRTIPTITNFENYSIVPYPERKQRTITVSVKPVNTTGKAMAARPLAIKPPSPLSWLPSMPSSTYNPRNELQRRTSPTAKTFGPTFPTSPPLTPMTPSSAQSFVTASTVFQPQSSGAVEDEESVYVLTLRTSEEIAQQMQSLRLKWFPAHRLKVPAHVTLFHALPESRLPQMEEYIVNLAQKTAPFEISTGRAMKMRKGVLVNLHAGDEEVRHLFGSMRNEFWDWLLEQDKSCKAHWTIQNKEEDVERVEAAFQDTVRSGRSLGQATGLVLWKYGDDGRWTKDKEFDFGCNSRSSSMSSLEVPLRRHGRPR